MPPSTWKPEFTARALELWEDYQRQHDLSSQVGKVAAIDPVSGRVWIDESGVDVVARMRSDGADVPVYFVTHRLSIIYQEGSPVITGTVDPDGAPVIELT